MSAEINLRGVAKREWLRRREWKRLEVEHIQRLAEKAIAEIERAIEQEHQSEAPRSVH